MIQDFKYAARSLARSPTFAIGATATLALGIAVNSTIFTLANNALFRSMPSIGSASQLVWVSGLSHTTGRSGGMSYPEYVDFEARSTHIFSHLLAYAPASFSLASGGEPERIRGHLVTGSYFATLGVGVIEGRTLRESDDQPAAMPVAVISRRLSQQRFGGHIPPRSIVVNGRAVTVVGIAPNGFVGPELGQSADVWVPISAVRVLNTSQAAWLADRKTLWLRVIGRRRPEVSGQQAQAVVSAIAATLEAEHPDSNKDRGAVLASASSGIRPSDRGEWLPISALLLTVTGLVLLIACANVSNLLLARGAGRATEIAIRAAVGASRWRIVRQLLAETVVLSAASGFLGLLVSLWATDYLLSRLPDADFGGLGSTVDHRVLLFTSVLAIGSACLFGLIPALSVTRRALLPQLRQTSGAGGRSRSQGFFVVMQLSLSLVLLLGAGLSIRALQKAAVIDLGFTPNGLVMSSYDLALQNYPAERRDIFCRDLARRVRALPGVESVTIADLPPLSGTMVSTIVKTVDRESPTESRAYMSSVAGDYFKTLEIALVRGRGIDETDRRGSPAVAVVNETLARRLWPAGDPIGRTIDIDDWRVDVVGVARDAKYDEATEDQRAFLYLALSQHSLIDRQTIIVRSSQNAMLIGAALREQIHALDASLPVFDVKSFAEVLRDRADKQRAFSALFAAFGALALALASLGLYGVMSYAVTRRTHEIGVRLALGATPRQLLRLIAEDGLRLTMTGVAAGTLLAYPLARVLGALIFGVQIADLATFALTCLVLVGVAMMAALLPARRAARLDPVAALRVE